VTWEIKGLVGGAGNAAVLMSGLQRIYSGRGLFYGRVEHMWEVNGLWVLKSNWMSSTWMSNWMSH
jgi:hypothetical protein